MDSPEIREILTSCIQIISAILLVLLNGFFVAAEFAFVKVRPTRITQLAEEGERRAIAAKACLDHLDTYLSVSQLGITLSSLGLGWLGEPAIASLIHPLLLKIGIHSPTLISSISFVLAFSLITFLHVVIGELAPKSVAIQKAESWTLALARPMQFFYLLFRPAVIVLNGTAGKLIKISGLQQTSETEITHTEEELRMIIAESYQGGQINKMEQELLENVFRFEERVIEEIMVPRPNVIFLDTRLSLKENLEVAKKYEHTRFPLIDGNPDHIKGMINIKDFLFVEQELRSIEDLCRDILFVPEGMPVERLMKEFQRSHQQMAVVIDEYGGTAGIVSMEDILEELVGEIQDEFDEEEPLILSEPDGTYLVNGMLLLEDAEKRFAFKVDDDHDQYNTLAGYLMGKLGKAPEIEDQVVIKSLQFTVVKMNGMQIEQIKIAIIPDKERE